MRWGGRCRLCFGGATSPGMDTTDPGREKVTQLQGAGTEIISWSSVLHLLGKKRQRRMLGTSNYQSDRILRFMLFYFCSLFPYHLNWVDSYSSGGKEDKIYMATIIPHLWLFLQGVIVLGKGEVMTLMIKLQCEKCLFITLSSRMCSHAKWFSVFFIFLDEVWIFLNLSQFLYSSSICIFSPPPTCAGTHYLSPRLLQEPSSRTAPPPSSLWTLPVLYSTAW